MLNILFWNLNGNAVENYIVNCIAENDIDIAIFSEFGGIKFDQLIDKLGGLYKHILGVQKDHKVSLIAKNTIIVKMHQQQNRYSLYSVQDAFDSYILSAVHLEDRRNNDKYMRMETIKNLVNDIECTERVFNCNNSIVIGDFNANPYDDELLDCHSFNSVLFKALIEKKELTNPRTKKKRRFYNPILHFISEETEMYGSFYYDKGSTTPYWHCLDQVLVRKSLANSISDMRYVKTINEKRLVGNISPIKEISDHLPLIVCLREAENGI